MVDWLSLYNFMDLFSEDIFSNPRNDSFTVEQSLFSFLINILSSCYDFTPNQIVSIKQFGGLSVNSTNFLVNSHQHSFVLKQLKSNIDETLIHYQLSVVQEINTFTPLMPELVLSNNLSTFIKLSDGTYWLLSRFVKGNHFSGLSTEISPTLSAISLLYNQLNQVKSRYPIDTPEVNCSLFANQVFSQFFSDSNCLNSSFAQNDANMILHNKSSLEKALIYTHDYCRSSSSLSTLFHVDIHPHNILIDDRLNVCFLDYDSICVGDVVKHHSYTTLKLLRQIAVSNGKDYAKCLVSRFLDYSFLPSTYLCGTAAVSEVVRRIMLVLNLNLRGDSSWNKALPALFSNLQESYFLYDLN